MWSISDKKIRNNIQCRDRGRREGERMFLQGQSPGIRDGVE